MANNYTANFNPREYLNEYYLVEPEIEDISVVRFMVEFLRDMPSGLLTLEFGGGPTLFAEAALAPKSKEIHFCDYVAASLNEIRLWLNNDPKAFNWDSYIKLALEEENAPTTPQAIAQRAAEMRRKITLLLACDALADAPLGKENTVRYDLVVAQAVTETVSSSISEWIRVIQNISTLVTPGGWLLISVLTGTAGYYIGDKLFSCVDLTDDDIRQGYKAAGYNLNTLRLEKLAAPGPRGYSGLTNAVARRKDD